MVGTFVNTTSTVTSDQATGSAASANLIVAPPLGPTLAKSFAPSIVAVGGTTTVTLVLSNPNQAATLTNLQYSDVLPPASFQFLSFGASTTCDLATFVNATGTLTVNQTSLASGASCTLSFNVKSLVAGTFVNTTSAVTSDLINGSPATATLLTVPPTRFLRGGNMIGRGTQAGVITFDPGPADSFKR